jgi:hypothetical protein
MSDFEYFKTIPLFYDYAVSNWGRVINKNKNVEMMLSPNQRGELTVGLMRDGNQYRRSVKLLVAKMFVPGSSDLHNTPIQKDGDRANMHADNIVWRPRWFAWKYRRQLEHIPDWAYTGPVIDNTMGLEYENIAEAAIALGLLFSDIRLSIYNSTIVFPVASVFSYKY